jgi:hypothetical protein
MINRIRIIAQTSIVLTALVLALEYWLGFRAAWCVLLILPGGLWLYGLRRDWYWLDVILLVFFSFAAAVGLLFSGSSVAALGVVLLALSTWEMANLYRHMLLIPDEDESVGLSKRHLRRLVIVEGVALLFAGSALLLEFELRFSLILLVGVAAIFGLSQVIGYLNRQVS